MSQQQKQQLLQAAQLSGLLFAACGFQAAQNTTIPSIMKKINPNGGTALRDSLIEGCKLMLKLHTALKQMGTADHYNFVHVVLTDGIDENSKSSLEDAIKIMLLIGQLISVKALKIIFIGVGVSNKAEKELQVLAAAGGQNAEYYNVNSADISTLFNKIEIGLGIQRNFQMVGVSNSEGSALIINQRRNPYLEITIKNFAIMFNLDVSGSMNGSKWTNVCSSVSNFIGKMGNTDLVSGVIFNDEVKLISSLNENDKLLQRPRSSSNYNTNNSTSNYSTNKTVALTNYASTNNQMGRTTRANSFTTNNNLNNSVRSNSVSQNTYVPPKSNTTKCTTASCCNIM